MRNVRRRGQRKAFRVVALSAAVLVTIAGCGRGPDSAGAVKAAEEFARQAASSPEQACGLLSERARDDLEQGEQSPCADALPQLGLPAPSAQRSVEVYEQHAQVVLADDVVFLARFDDGWKVTAAGCEAQPDDEPYECALGG